MKEKLKQRVRELTAIDAPSGSEQRLAEHICAQLAGGPFAVHTDNMGSVIAHLPRPGKPRLLISAHMDEVGLMINSISADGFLQFSVIGGLPEKILEARQVRIDGHVPGVIGMKSAHLQTPEERNSVPRAAGCYIDVGAASAEQVRALGIEIGSTAVLRGDFTELASPELVTSKALDDRLGCAVLLELLLSLEPERVQYDLYGCFTVQEETGTGCAGARAAAAALAPQYAIALDTLPVGDVPGFNPDWLLPVYLGKGAAVVMAEGGAFMHPAIKKMLLDAANKSGAPLQRVSMRGIGYASESATIASAGGGVSCGSLTIPRRSSHSPVEVCHMDDVLSAWRILKAAVEK